MQKQTSEMSSSRNAFISQHKFTCTLAGLILLSFCLILNNTVLKCPTLGYDEAYRAFKGAVIYRDIIDLDFVAFFHDTNRQRFWPFLYSWYLAIFYLPLGVSVITARIGALTAYCGCLISIALAAKQCDPKRSYLIGILSGWIFLCNPEMTRHAAITMLEVPGMLLSILFLYSLNRYLENPNRGTAISTGIFLGLQFYLKYNYAFFSTVTGILIFGFAWREGRIKLKEIQLRTLLIVYLLMVLVWILPTFKGKIRAILKFGINTRYIESSFWSWDYLGYYLKCIFTKYSTSVFVGILLLIGLSYAATRWQNWRLRSYLIFSIVAFLMATIHPFKAPRYGLSFAGLLPLYSALAISELASRLESRWPKKSGYFLCALILIFLAFTSPLMWQTQTALNAHPPDLGLVQALDWMAHKSRGAHRIWVSGTFEELSPPMIDFALMTRLGRRINHKYRESLIVEYAHSPGVHDKEQEDYLLEDLRSALSERKYNCVFLISINESSPFNTPYSLNYYPLNQAYRPFLLNQPYYRKTDQKCIDRAGICVTLYEPLP